MAVPSTKSTTKPNLRELLSPLLPALIAATASPTPPTPLLPSLSPILRQRVQFLSATSSEPWLRLLCYNTSAIENLKSAASVLEPHPLSGEVEVDWEHDTEVAYKRIDGETLQGLVKLQEQGLVIRIVWCVNDPDGPDGWRIGEVLPQEPDTFREFGGSPTMDEAEESFQSGGKAQHGSTKPDITLAEPEQDDDDDDDDDYWAQYDATPGRGRTPATKSPAPTSTKDAATAEREYFAQYENVQPAMDNHDPDEEVPHVSPPLGLGQQPSLQQHMPAAQNEGILQPRPESSASSSTSERLVAKLEEEAGRRDTGEFGVKQHISRSIRSLYQLGCAAGIERDEFESLVRRELEVLSMMEDA